MLTTSSAEELFSYISEVNPKIIGIDGKDHSGKSFLSKQIKNHLGYKVFNLDSFLIEKQDKFVSAIKYDLLVEQINKEKSSFIIEGACLRQVLDNLQLDVSLQIYVKRMTPSLYWQD